MTVYEDAAKRPGVHVLAIGVGDYWHMRGGKEPRGLAADMKTLDSPQRSAAAFADWAKEALPGAAPGLGSLELVIGDGEFEGQACGPATLDAIIAASQRWRDRCDADAGNVALFYFCGHGVRGADDFLLAQDFGARETRFWENAFRFRATYAAMASCKARTQLYFVDACRNIPREWLKRGTDSAGPLFDPLAEEDRPRDANILYSTAANDFAQGTPGGVSPFTTELLRCLRKFGATRGPGGPVVTTGSLVRAVQEIFNPPLDSGKAQRAMRDGESVGDTPLYGLPGAKALWRHTLPEDGAVNCQPPAVPAESDWELDAFSPYACTFVPKAGGAAYRDLSFEAIPPVMREAFRR